MIKKITCIECPKGCTLCVEVKDGVVTQVTGQGCPKGYTYAVSETEKPMRVLTSTVLAEELSLKMVPVRTDQAVPKSLLWQGMEEIKKIKLKKAVHAGDIIVKKFLGLDVNLIVTRDAYKG